MSNIVFAACYPNNLTPPLAKTRLPNSSARAAPFPMIRSTLAGSLFRRGISVGMGGLTARNLGVSGGSPVNTKFRVGAECDQHMFPIVAMVEMIRDNSLGRLP